MRNRETREQDSGLSRAFRRLLATAVSMPLVAIIGGTIAFYFFPRVGYVIVLVSVAMGISCLVACLLLRLTGRHLSKEK